MGVAAVAEDIVNIIVEDTIMTGEVIADMTTAGEVVMKMEVCLLVLLWFDEFLREF